jgi:two-component system nitrogen regulation response regulator GlnG
MTGGSFPKKGLAELVERHLERYFEAHQGIDPGAGLYENVLREIEKPLLYQTLLFCEGNQKRAADILGINRNTLRKKIHDLGIKINKDKIK